MAKCCLCCTVVLSWHWSRSEQGTGTFFACVCAGLPFLKVVNIWLLCYGSLVKNVKFNRVKCAVLHGSLLKGAENFCRIRKCYADVILISKKIVKKEANTLFEGHLFVQYFSMSIPVKFRLFRYGLYQKARFSFFWESTVFVLWPRNEDIFFLIDQAVIKAT